jgi:hypothetical protein
LYCKRCSTGFFEEYFGRVAFTLYDSDVAAGLCFPSRFLETKGIGTLGDGFGEGFSFGIGLCCKLNFADADVDIGDILLCFVFFDEDVQSRAAGWRIDDGTVEFVSVGKVGIVLLFFCCTRLSVDCICSFFYCIHSWIGRLWTGVLFERRLLPDHALRLWWEKISSCTLQRAFSGK